MGLVTMFLSKGLSLGCILVLLNTALSAEPPSVSPAANADLICHTNNPEECYPRVFQPTKNFQMVKDDQDLPPGLHVRMDIWSGIKEARLNTPMEGEEAADPEARVEQAMVVVPQPQPEEDVDASRLEQNIQKALRDQFSKKPPAYEAAGKIPAPLSEEGMYETTRFTEAVALVSNHQPATKPSALLHGALTELSDLAHDLYYGVEICKDKQLVHALFSLMSGRDSAESHHSRRTASGVLGHAIQNNPTALKWLMDGLASAHAQPETLLNTFLDVIEAEVDPDTTKSLLRLLDGLVKDPSVRSGLAGPLTISSNTYDASSTLTSGLNLLLQIYVDSLGKEWYGVREKIAQFVMDNYLDEEMGADPALPWPKDPISAASDLCTDFSHRADDGCWEYQVESRGKDQGADEEWQTAFLRSLKARREKTRGKKSISESDKPHIEL